VSGGKLLETIATFLVSEVGSLQDWLLVLSGKRQSRSSTERYTDQTAGIRWLHYQRCSAASRESTICSGAVRHIIDNRIWWCIDDRDGSSTGLRRAVGERRYRCRVFIVSHRRSGRV
jgi:hypothetical protein